MPLQVCDDVVRSVVPLLISDKIAQSADRRALMLRTIARHAVRPHTAGSTWGELTDIGVSLAAEDHRL